MDSKERRLRALYIIETSVFALVLFLCLGLLVWRLFTPPLVIVSGRSMVPTYENGDLLKCEEPDMAELKQGDVLILSEPGADRLLVKRLIGLPGDKVTLTDKDIYVNGTLLTEPYVNDHGPYHEAEYVLSDDEYFVLGDNRDHSKDSRSFGPVRSQDIRYRAAGVSRILNKVLFSTFHNTAE